MTTFEGFADDKASFFAKLAKNQKREWFQAHKAEFDEGYQQPMKALLEEVRAGVDKAFPHCDLAAPKVFRIFRDVRFSKDKSPYKTHIGGHIMVDRKGQAHLVPIALYLHVGQPSSFAAAGHYMMEPDVLKRFRAAVVDDARGKELDKILKALGKKGYAITSHEMYKRVPAGFDPEHPRAEHLRRKGLIAEFPAIPKGMLASKKLAPWLVGHVKATAPLVEWLVYATA